MTLTRPVYPNLIVMILLSFVHLRLASAMIGSRVSVYLISSCSDILWVQMSTTLHAPPRYHICENPIVLRPLLPMVYHDLFIAPIVDTTAVFDVDIKTPKIDEDRCYYYRDNHHGNVMGRLSISEQMFRDHRMSVVMMGPPLDHQLWLQCHAKCISCTSSRLPKKCYPEKFPLDPVYLKPYGFKSDNHTFIAEVAFTIRPRPRKFDENRLHRCAFEALQ